MKKITNLEIGAITFFLIRTYFVGITFNNLITISKQDSWLSIIIAIIIGMIPLLALFYIFNYEPDLSLHEKNVKLFGKVFGNIINIVFCIFVFFTIIIIFNNLILCIHSEYLIKTPTLIIGIMFMIAIFYTLRKSIDVHTRAGLILFYISIVFILFSNISVISQIDLNNFKPILYTKTNIFKGSLSFLAYNILPIFLLLMIPKNKIKNNNKTFKTIFLFYLIGCISLFVINFNIIGIFGIKLSLIYQYPEFQVLKYVSLMGLSSRIDSILFIQWIFDLMAFVIIAFDYILLTTHSLIDEKKNIFLSIYSILVIIISQFTTNNVFINNLSLTILPNIINIVILIIFGLILFKIKWDRNKSKKV